MAKVIYIRGMGGTNSLVYANDFYENKESKRREESIRQNNKDEEMKFFGKKKSDETIQKEKSERKYTSRKNICKDCFVAKSMNGECNCD